MCKRIESLESDINIGRNLDQIGVALGFGDFEVCQNKKKNKTPCKYIEYNCL